MHHDVEAIYDHGVLRPIAPLALPEGARVHLRVAQINGDAAVSPKLATDYKSWLNEIAGSWQGDFIRV